MRITEICNSFFVNKCKRLFFKIIFAILYVILKIMGGFMKGKIKNLLFSASIFYSVLIVGLMIFTCITMTDSVELYDNGDNKLNEYKEIVSNMEDNECTLVIKDIIKYYEDTSYNGSVNLKEMYDYDGENGLLSYSIKAKDACNVSYADEKEYDLSTKFLSSIMYREGIYQRYGFQYELKFTDMYLRDIAEASIYSTEYHISRKTILDIISSLIEISSKEVSTDE